MPMKNAASKGMVFPMMGLGAEGHGYKLGQKAECWHYPQCCTDNHCPIINSVADWINLVNSRGEMARIDTGYPYGDNHEKNTCKHSQISGQGDLFLQENAEEDG